MQNASAPPANLSPNNTVAIVEVTPSDDTDTDMGENNEVPQQNNETPEQVLSSYEDQGRVPPPLDNHMLEDVGTE
jgi:hypothetical protein